MLFWTIMLKDLRLLFRDRSALIFILAMPVAVVLTFGLIFGDRGERGSLLKIVVANQDQGKHGAEVVKTLRQMGLTVEETTVERLLVQVRSGRRAIGVLLPSDFSKQLDKAVKLGFSATPAQQAHLEVKLDPAQSSLAGMAQSAIGAAMQRVVSPLYREAAMARVPPEFRQMAMQIMGNPNSARLGENRGGPQPFQMDVQEVGGPLEGSALRARASLGDTMVPDYCVLFVFFLANGIASSLIMERQDGTLRRMLCAPVTPGQILLGKLLARGVLGLIQVFLLFAIGRLWLNLGVGSSPLGVFLTALATIFAATGMGLLLASFGKTPEQITSMTTLALVLMGAISGCMVPRMMLPETMQKLSLITPHAWALTAYQDLLLRHLPLEATLQNIGVVFLFGMVFTLFAVARFRHE